MRKALIMILFFLVLIGQHHRYCRAEDTTEVVEEKMKEAITEVYLSVDNLQLLETSSVFSEDVLQYIQKKIEINHLVIEKNHSQKEDYSVLPILLEIIEDGQFLRMKFQVIIRYIYEDLKEERSGYSEEAYILYDLNDGKIVDFYVPINYYDIAVRLDSQHEYISFDFTEDNEYKINQLIEDIKQEFDQKCNVENQGSDLVRYTQDKNSMRSNIINYNGIVNYARSNFNRTNPLSGNGIVPYYDFSLINGNYDCTNFVSHSLLGGGASVYDTGGTGISSTGWYYRNINNRSSSWSVVEHLYNYMINNAVDDKLSGTSFLYVNQISGWVPGCLMQFRFSGGSQYRHSTVITKRTVSGNTATAYVTGRTSSTQWNNNQKADDMAPGGSRRVIVPYIYHTYGP